MHQNRNNADDEQGTPMTNAKKDSAIGSRYDDFLADDGMLEAARVVAIQRVVTWLLATMLCRLG